MKRDGSTTMALGRHSAHSAWCMLGLLLLGAIVCGPVAADPGSIALSINGPVTAEDLSFDRTAAVPVPAALKRGFYLTNTSYHINEVLTACAKGYHMASMWELLNVTTLVYHYNHPYAYQKADSGYGVPSGWNGWARTGYDSSSTNLAGTGNCLNWTSVSASDYGTAVRLSPDWTASSGAFTPWIGGSFPCNFTGPVWCISDKNKW